MCSVTTYLCIKCNNYYSLLFNSTGTILVQTGHQTRNGLGHAGTKSSEITKPIHATVEQNTITHTQSKDNGKAVPLQAWSGPEGSRKLRFSDFMTTAQDGGKVVSLTHWPPIPPGNTPGTQFCQRMSRPQGHGANRRIMSLKNSNDTIRN